MPKSGAHTIKGFIDPLTDGDLQLLRLVASGRTILEIAPLTGYSRHSLGSYLSRRLYENLVPEEYKVDARIQCTKLYWQWELGK